MGRSARAAGRRGRDRGGGPRRRGSRRSRRCAVEHGVPFVSVADDHDAIAALLGLDADARAAGVTLAGGCGLAPGLADVLARHAAGALDTVEEVHVARAGVAGPSSATVVRRARGEKAAEWRDGAWQDARAAGPELVWFPDPIGARDCELAAGGLDLLVRALPGIAAASLRLAEPPARGMSERLNERLTRRSAPEGWGATRVEVHGTRGSARESIVYGVVERTAVAAGTVLALVAAHLSGALPLGPSCAGGRARSRRARRPGAVPRRARPPRRESRGVRGRRGLLTVRHRSAAGAVALAVLVSSGAARVLLHGRRFVGIEHRAPCVDLHDGPGVDGGLVDDDHHRAEAGRAAGRRRRGVAAPEPARPGGRPHRRDHGVAARRSGPGEDVADERAADRSCDGGVVAGGRPRGRRARRRGRPSRRAARGVRWRQLVDGRRRSRPSPPGPAARWSANCPSPAPTWCR